MSDVGPDPRGDDGRKTHADDPQAAMPVRSRDSELAGSGEGVPTTSADGAATTSLWGDAWRELRGKPMFLISLGIILLFVLMALFPRLFLSFYPGDVDPRSCSLSNSLGRPDGTNWFGFDLQGCDYYTRTIYGARVSIAIGVTVTAVAVIIATVFGALAGYYGGFIDTVIARLTDMWFAIPVILGGIVAITVLRNASMTGDEGNVVIATLTNLFSFVDRLVGTRGFGVVSFVLIVLGWPTMLRLMRSSVLSAREADYVEAARALGASDLRIIRRHILPNAITPVIVYATISVGVIIAAEAALSFLGVGLVLPAISWGLMISSAQNRILSVPHLLFFPGVFLSLAVFGFILMGDALRDAFDPKQR